MSDMEIGKDPLVEHLRHEFDPGNWRTGRGQSGYGFWMDFSAVPFVPSGWSVRPLELSRNGQVPPIVLIRLVSTEDPGKVVNISFTESDSEQAAHESLLQELATTMAGVQRVGAQTLGDVCFTGNGPEEGLFMFTRENICVTVGSTGERPTSVLSLAQALDRVISGPTEPVPGGPFIEVFGFPPVIPINQDVFVSLSVRGREEGIVARHLQTRAGRFRRQDGLLFLHCESEGVYPVHLTAIDKHGRTSRLEAVLTVVR